MVTLKMHQKPLTNLYQHKYSEESFLFVGGINVRGLSIFCWFVGM